MNSLITDNNTQRTHPHKFMMWMAIGSICMMFAGLTSAYIVKKHQSNFLEFNLPTVFWYSTIVIILSSGTIYLAAKFFKENNSNYKLFITLTSILGLLFMILQIVGFKNLESHGIHLTGFGSNAAASFLLVIVGLHMLHVAGGVIALLVLFFKGVFTKKLTNVSLEIISTYWHFVDILWLYLLIFFIWLK